MSKDNSISELSITDKQIVKVLVGTYGYDRLTRYYITALRRELTKANSCIDSENKLGMARTLAAINYNASMLHTLIDEKDKDSSVN